MFAPAASNQRLTGGRVSVTTAQVVPVVIGKQWHLYCICTPMKGSIRTFVENPSSEATGRRRYEVRATATSAMLGALLLFLASSGFAGTTEIPTDSHQETAQERLATALQHWANQHLASSSDKAPTYTFALKDKRLAIPDCQRFMIDPSGLIPGRYAPPSLTVDAACPATSWQRKIRGRLQQGSSGGGTLNSKAASVAVLQPIHSIEKGQRVQETALQKVWLPAQRVPQNAITWLRPDDYYAARNLRKGQTLVASDLAVGQAVVVVVQAIPARSRITPDMIAIRQRAVGVPKDAYRSFEGLQMLAANRLLHPGDILRKRDLTKARLVKRGQRVAVESVGAYFRIASELVALQDGFLGDQIELRNPGSDRQVTAIVTGAGKARSL